ncbi:MAG TPA: HDOD domain-containing protein [Bryobacteraceae bacterium]|nr:HDOD domain-containing protein [Bryobacteraceae bacterium]
MEEVRETEELRLSPAAEARAGHARRVAMWCGELARVFSLVPNDLRLLERAALLHQYPRLVLNDEAIARLLNDMGLPQPERSSADQDVIRLLSAFERSRPASDARMARLASILEMCDAFDESFEAEALAPAEDGGETARNLREVVCSMLQGSCRADLLNALDRLPVFPLVAQRALVMLADENCSFPVVEKLVSSDAVLAGQLVAAANSAALGGAVAVSTIRAALVRVGLTMARRIVLSASLRPMFASRRLQKLWNHSLETAEMAASLARRSPHVDSDQAFLAGLVHDIGQLMLLRLPADTASRYVRLLDANCPPVLAETALFGNTHAELGGEALKRWNFPEPILLGVTWHHAPERVDSALAAVLYLAEECADAPEHLPSAFRIEYSCEKSGVTYQEFLAVRPEAGALGVLRFPAQDARL